MSGRRSRLRAGCQRCRVRHLKCDENESGCGLCQQAGIACDRSNIRFRNGLSVPKEPRLAFPELDSWPQVFGRVRFHDETADITNLYSVEGHSAFIDETPDNVGALLPDKGVANEPDQHQNIAASHSPSTASSSLSTQLRSSRVRHPLSEREAILMRNFVENMALWADITDPQRHFETEVSVRAFKEPVLRYAIFAFSSRHMNRKDNSDATEALQHHNCCVQLLIPALSGPRDSITEDILAAVAILRQHEEMDGEDNLFHLTGTTHILNTVSTFGSSGGLGEAAAWLCLRQDIYISLTNQQPLRTNLHSFHHSDVFQRTDDFAWSSRMVFLLAKVVQSAFTDSALAHGVQQEIEEWNSNKPDTFHPVRSASRGPELDRRFPTIWMLLPVHVIGIQYYHIAKILLALSEAPRAHSAYESLRHSRLVEKHVRHHLLTVLGLAQSNSKAENTLFTARHSLVAWGWVLRDPLDQSAAELLLQAMDARTGWNMDTLIQSLRAQWQEMEGDN